MAFCKNCRIEVEGRFCPQCGSLLEGAGTPGRPGSPDHPEQLPRLTEAALPRNVAATLCYVLGFVSGFLFLLWDPYNRDKLIRFHALQSIFLSIAALVISVAVSVIVPFPVTLLLSPLLTLFWLVLWVFMLWKTYQGQKVVLPVIGPLAEQQA